MHMYVNTPCKQLEGKLKNSMDIQAITALTLSVFSKSKNYEFEESQKT